MTLLSIAAAAAAQTQPTPGAPAPQPQLDVTALLKSPDPRLQAWLVRRGLQRMRIGALRQVVVAERLSQGRRGTSGQRTLDIVLDGATQLQVLIDVAWLPRSRGGPAQALIVASLAGEDADGFCAHVMHRRRGSSVRRCDILLAAIGQRSCCCSVCSRLKVRTCVYDGHMMGSGGGGAAGVGCGAGGLAPGLPPWADYGLTSSAHVGVTVLATGPTPVYYRRTVGPAGRTPSGSTVFLDGPTGDDRLKYVAAAVGIDLPVRGYEQHSVSVKDGSSLDSELTRIEPTCQCGIGASSIRSSRTAGCRQTRTHGTCRRSISRSRITGQRQRTRSPQRSGMATGPRRTGSAGATGRQRFRTVVGSATRVPGDDAVVRASRPDRLGDPLARATPISRRGRRIVRRMRRAGRRGRRSRACVTIAGPNGA